MIIVQLLGGLGNQMFQYATARKLTFINNTSLKFDVNGFDTIALDTSRKYELNVFNIEDDFASRREIAKFREYTINGKPTMRYRILNLLPNYAQTHMREKYYEFDPDILKLGDNIYLEGFWQSEKYFSDIADILIKDFAIKDLQNDENIKITSQIDECVSVALHVRRGDYVSNESTYNYHGICSDDYYQTAVRIMADNVKDPHFFMFSDDPDWVKNNLKINYPTTYVNCNGAERGHEDMRLMIKCKHQIIANSSFSWWGAWLNRNVNKIVIAPSKWFKDRSINTKDLLPDSWIKI